MGGVASSAEFPGVVGKNLIQSENTGFLRHFPESSAA
jgi:hypothetical protein